MALRQRSHHHRIRVTADRETLRGMAGMKAFVVEKYGKDGLRAADVPEPTVGEGDVIVRVAAASINPLDKMVRNGEFKQLLKYKPSFTLGHDVAGVVTQVGARVRDFKVGDEVYARPRDLRIGTVAERIAIDQDDLAPTPQSLTLHEAAAVPLVALASWQILVDRAHVQPGRQVLIHAGAGGPGSTAIQLAKHLVPRSQRRAHRRSFYVELLAYVTLRPRGVTAEDVAEAFGLRTERARIDLSILRSWLGKDPRTGDPFLPNARQTHAPGVPATYRTEGILTDLELFRRLRRRGQSRGAAGYRGSRRRSSPGQRRAVLQAS
jgi:hypothetical protein